MKLVILPLLLAFSTPALAQFYGDRSDGYYERRDPAFGYEHRHGYDRERWYWHYRHHHCPVAARIAGLCDW
jgi:hypothetical protein